MFTRRGLQSRSKKSRKTFFVLADHFNWRSPVQELRVIKPNTSLILETHKPHNETDELGDEISHPAHRWVYLLLPGLQKTTERGSLEGTDRTRFLWRKPSETEANICTALLSWVLPCHGFLAQHSAIKFPLTTKVFPWRHILQVVRIRESMRGQKDQSSSHQISCREKWSDLISRHFLIWPSPFKVTSSHRQQD